MKKISIVFAVLTAMSLMISCGGSQNENQNDEPDTDTVTDEDSVDADCPSDTEPGCDMEPNMELYNSVRCVR